MDRRFLCVRPMCAAEAEVALHYDYAARTVWLEPLGAHLAPGAWGLCATHGGGLKVPSGWTLVDRSRPEPATGPDRRLAFRPPLAV